MFHSIETEPQRISLIIEYRINWPKQQTYIRGSSANGGRWIMTKKYCLWSIATLTHKLLQAVHFSLQTGHTLHLGWTTRHKQPAQTRSDQSAQTSTNNGAATWQTQRSLSLNLLVVKNPGCYRINWRPAERLCASKLTCEPHNFTDVICVDCDRWTRPALTQPDRLVLHLPTPEGWKAELTLVVGYILRWFTYPQTVTHPDSNHLAATRPGVKLTTFWLQVHCPSSHATKPRYPPDNRCWSHTTLHIAGNAIGYM